MSGEIYVTVEPGKQSLTRQVAKSLQAMGPEIVIADVLPNLGIIELRRNDDLDLESLKIGGVTDVRREKIPTAQEREESARWILGNALREIAELRVHLKPSFSGLLHDVTKVSVEDFIFDGKEGF